MSEITAVEFEKREAHLSSELEDGPPYTVHGIALGSGDVTRGASGIKKVWPEEELEKAAGSLEGKNLVVDHENNVSGVVGEITKSGFEESVGILYEAELFEDELAEKISNGLLEVSVRGYHKDVDELEEEDGAKVVEDIQFDNLSVVPDGASPSNTLEMGPAEELSVAALSEYVGELEETVEAGDFVQWGDMHGVVLTMPEDGEVEVDVYEEIDGMWRSVEETEMVSVDDLSSWDVDPDEEVGAAQEEENETYSDDVMGQINEFVSNESEDAPLSQLAEWTENRKLIDSINEYTKIDSKSIDDSVGEFIEWHNSSEEEEVEELQEWEFHEASWNDTTESEWSAPDLEDFEEEELGEVSSHFLISQSGFPPENFTDLALPIVEPDGSLNVNALAAVKGGRGASAVEGLSEEMEDQITEYVNTLAREEFDRDWGMEEASSTDSNKDPVSVSLDLINTFLRQNGRAERDSVDSMLGWLFGSTDIATEEISSLRTAATSFLDQQGGIDSFDAVDVESFRDWLLVQGSPSNTSGDELPPIATPVHVLSGDDLRTALSVGASKNGEPSNENNTNMTEIEEELSELDEPVAVEKEDFESLQDKADRFDDMSENIEALRERTEVLDSVDREQVEELAESDDPVVLSSDEYEELSAEAEQVKTVYAEALSEESPFSADDLADKFSIEELREKYEEAGHELEEELSAEPKSGDLSEEELEERAEQETKSEEELAEEQELEERRSEIREKILN